MNTVSPIKINFCDFWPGFENENLFIRFLQKHFNVVIDKDPDYLFFSVYGNKHFAYENCVKVQFTGENILPDFNLCDYAIGFHYLEFDDRYLRFPLYVLYQWHHAEHFIPVHGNLNDASFISENLVNRKFCNFVYSNRVYADPFRDAFFLELNKYKRVDSGGRHLNNIGGPIQNKLSFIKDYKFTIAFENSCVPGYTTEKLIEPILIKSMPVYYGDPLVDLDFNTDAFVIVKNPKKINEAIEEIISLDKNDELYINKLSLPPFKPGNEMKQWESKLLQFIGKIFEKPLAEARRRPCYGFNKYYTGELKLQSELLEQKRRMNVVKLKIKGFWHKIFPLTRK